MMPICVSLMMSFRIHMIIPQISELIPRCFSAKALREYVHTLIHRHTLAFPVVRLYVMRLTRSESIRRKMNNPITISHCHQLLFSSIQINPYRSRRTENLRKKTLPHRTMGQQASKELSKAAGKVAKEASNLKRPPIPKRTPDTTTASTEGNAGSFLRGTGIAAQDIRDRGQEMYLQQVQDRSVADNKNAKSSAQTSKNTEMPEDLLKFIQDVGPTEKSVDREFTSSRLLKDENVDELNKLESNRTARRERVRMPLMQGEDSFVTEKNTNFSASTVVSSADKHDFGLTHVQLYEFLTQLGDAKGEGKFIDEFHKKIVSDSEERQTDYSSPKGQELKKTELHLMEQTLKVLEVPTLRTNEDGDILGLHSKDVPGPEMKSISTIPEDKIMIVLKDLSMNPDISSKT